MLVQKAELARMRERAAIILYENDARVAKAAIRSEIERARDRRRKGSRQQRDMGGAACRLFQSGKLKAE